MTNLLTDLGRIGRITSIMNTIALVGLLNIDSRPATQQSASVSADPSSAALNLSSARRVSRHSIDRVRTSSSLCPEP